MASNNFRETIDDLRSHLDLCSKTSSVDLRLLCEESLSLAESLFENLKRSNDFHGVDSPASDKKNVSDILQKRENIRDDYIEDMLKYQAQLEAKVRSNSPLDKKRFDSSSSGDLNLISKHKKIDLDYQVEMLTDQNAELKKQLTDFKKQNILLKEKNSELKSLNADLVVKNSELKVEKISKSDVVFPGNEITKKLQNSMAEKERKFSKRLSDKNEEIKEHKREIKKLNKKILEVNKIYEELKIEMKSYEEDIVILHKQLDEKSLEVDLLQCKIESPDFKPKSIAPEKKICDDDDDDDDDDEKRLNKLHIGGGQEADVFVAQKDVQNIGGEIEKENNNTTTTVKNSDEHDQSDEQNEENGDEFDRDPHGEISLEEHCESLFDENRQLADRIDVLVQTIESLRMKNETLEGEKLVLNGLYGQQLEHQKNKRLNREDKLLSHDEVEKVENLPAPFGYQIKRNFSVDDELGNMKNNKIEINLNINSNQPQSTENPADNNKSKGILSQIYGLFTEPSKAQEQEILRAMNNSVSRENIDDYPSPKFGTSPEPQGVHLLTPRSRQKQGQEHNIVATSQSNGKLDSNDSSNYSCSAGIGKDLVGKVPKLNIESIKKEVSDFEAKISGSEDFAEKLLERVQELGDVRNGFLDRLETKHEELSILRDCKEERNFDMKNLLGEINELEIKQEVLHEQITLLLGLCLRHGRVPGED